MKLTRSEFEATHPELFAEIADESYQKGLSDGTAKGKAEGMASGAEAERNRIRDVESQLVGGHEAIIQEMKYDGRSTGPEAAVKILAAERELRRTRLKEFQGEHTTVVKHDPPSMTEKLEQASEANLPPEERAKKDWDNNPRIRQEFRLGGFASYLAWLKNEPNVRIMGGKE